MVKLATVMADGAVRDMSGRRFPAHLDTRYSDDGWWHGPERYSRAQPWYTFDRERTVRDWYRGRSGTAPPAGFLEPSRGIRPSTFSYLADQNYSAGC